MLWHRTVACRSWHAVGAFAGGNHLGFASRCPGFRRDGSAIRGHRDSRFESKPGRRSGAGKARRMKMELHATPQEVMRAVEALQEFGRAEQVPDKILHGLALALEECGCNIITHALGRDSRKKF